MGGVVVLAGRYRLVERVGAGGMSVVWRAYDEVLGRQVAVKVLNGSYAADGASRRLIRSEAKAAARLSHRHLTNVYDYGEDVCGDGDRVPFVVMELVEGPTLAEKLADGRLPWRTAVRIAAEVAAGLAAVHARGLVHRDIKPANVILTPVGAKVVDFGIAAIAGSRAGDAEGEALLGTPAYVAPERVTGDPVTPATDVYALGVLVYRALSGVLPWRVETPTELVQAHCSLAPDPLPVIDGLPVQVVDLCHRCLAKQPTDRPDSAEVAAVLSAALLSAPAEAQPTEPPTAADAGDEPTTILSTNVCAMAVAAPGPARKRSRRVRATVGVAVAGLALAGLLAATTDIGSHRARAVAAADPVAAGPPACAVQYRTRRDADRSFTVDVTVANTGDRTVSDWTLAFAFPGDQDLTTGSGGVWSQRGQTVTVRPAAGANDLPVQATAALAFTGTYTAGNPLPTAFTLDGRPCTVQVAGTTSTTPISAAGPAPATGAAPAITTAGGGGAGAGAADPVAGTHPVKGKPKHSKKPKH